MKIDPKPSASELSILKIIWLQSPLSAREIHDRIVNERQWSFSSTRKTLDRMQDKSYISSSQVHGVRVFTAKLNKLKTLASYVTDFAHRVLELDGPLPVSMFVDSKLLSSKEVKQLETLLDELEDSHNDE